ncbi:3183_t:CDS:1, partial [Rhizophagus irregularis]
TTRSAAQKGIDNQEEEETMEGVISTTPTAQDTSNNFTFTPNDEKFTTVKSRATLRHEHKKKKK